MAPSLESTPARLARIQLQLDLLALQARDFSGKLDACIESLEQQLDRGLERAMQTALDAAVAADFMTVYPVAP